MGAYCVTCNRHFKSLGIARHRAKHRDAAEVCEIHFFRTGKTVTYDFSKRRSVFCDVAGGTHDPAK